MDSYLYLLVIFVVEAGSIQHTVQTCSSDPLEKIHKSQQKKQKSPHDFTPFKELENHL